jgi:hypothetical protein
MATAAATVETPTNRGNKAACPQETSPMARDTEKDDNLDIQSLGMEIDGNGDASAEEDDQDSIVRAISSTRKELFASTSSKSLSKLSGAAKAWRPITPRDTPAQDVGASRGATFAAETVFHERSSTPRTATRRPRRQTTAWCAFASSCSHATSKKPLLACLPTASWSFRSRTSRLAFSTGVRLWKRDG